MSIAMFKQKVNFTISHHQIKIIMMVDILNPIAYMFVCFFFYLNYMWFSVGGGGLFSPLKKISGILLWWSVHQAHWLK